MNRPAARASITLEVVECRSERHGKDEIILAVYSLPHGGRFTYSVQCHLGRFVQSLFPWSIAGNFTSPLEAKRAAVKTLREWTRRSRSAKERLRRFGVMAVEQREFDFH